MLVFSTTVFPFFDVGFFPIYKLFFQKLRKSFSNRHIFTTNSLGTSSQQNLFKNHLMMESSVLTGRIPTFSKSDERHSLAPEIPYRKEERLKIPLTHSLLLKRVLKEKILSFIMFPRFISAEQEGTSYPPP